MSVAYASTPVGHRLALAPAARLAVFMRALHTAVGVFVAPLLLIAAVTGLAYAATPQLEAWWYAPANEAAPATDGQPALPLARQIARASATLAGSAEPVAVRPGQPGRQTTRVMFARPGGAPNVTTAVFVDPTSGRVTGQLAAYGTSGTLPIRRIIDQLHRSLLLGSVGRLYSELAASWLGVAALGGVWLWWRRRAARASRSAPRRWHQRAGPWLAIGLIGFSVTGLTWSQFAGQQIGVLRVWAGWQTPALAAHEHGGMTGETAPTSRATYDRMLAVARAHGLTAERIEIRPPAGAGAIWAVAEIDRRWPSQVDRIAVDGPSGRVVDESRFEDYPIAAKLTRWGIDAHTGVLFGWVNQLVLGVFAAGLIGLVGLGWAGLARGRRTGPRITLWQSLAGLTRSQQLGLLAAFVPLAVLLPVWAASCPVLIVLDAAAGRLGRRG